MTVAVASGALAACSLLVSVDELTGASTPVDASVDTTPPQDGQEQRDSVSPEAALEAGLPAYAAAVLRDAPMLYLRLEEMTGPLAHAERGIDATYFGSVQPGVPGAFPGSRAIRLEGPPQAGALLLDGAPFAFAGAAPFTLEAWFRFDAYDTSFRHIFTRFGEPDGGREEYVVYLQQDKGLSFERWIGGIASGTGTASPPAPLAWHHVAATYDAKRITVYVDGVTVGFADDARLSQPADAPLKIGEGFRGSIDEVAVYDRALPALVIAAHVAAAR